ncbi:MAG: hypothetical protein DWQ04_29835 [Chloroflexi bacterium]|nr:MAG: hypothetical protein DWQ04_29835 [Chloroflexota bacterium]
MRIIIDRGLCNSGLAFCQRCSAAFIGNPMGYDRPCIREIVEDGSELLTLEMYTDGRTLVVELTEEDREIAAVEGWESLVNFDPALFRTGAMRRWRQLQQLPANH